MNYIAAIIGYLILIVAAWFFVMIKVAKYQGKKMGREYLEEIGWYEQSDRGSDKES